MFRTLVVLSVAASLVQSEQLTSTPLQRFLDFVPSIERSKPACEQYNGMYNQCLPSREWMCDKPPVYDVLDRNTLKSALYNGSIEYSKLLSGACIGTANKRSASKVYDKFPVCREVKTLIEFVRVFTQQFGDEVCQVVFNSEEFNVQKVYKTECFHGNPSVKAVFRKRCSFDYGTKADYYCKPTNFVNRKMVVYCPFAKLQFVTKNVATACSCVKVGCKQSNIK